MMRHDATAPIVMSSAADDHSAPRRGAASAASANQLFHRGVPPGARVPLRLAAFALLAFVAMSYWLLRSATHDPFWWKQVHHGGAHQYRQGDDDTAGRRPPSEAESDDFVEKTDAAIHAKLRPPRNRFRELQALGEKRNDVEHVVHSSPVELIKGKHYFSDYEINAMKYRGYDYQRLLSKGEQPRFHYVDPEHPALNFSILTVSEEPVIHLIPDFLTDEECEQLIDAAKPSLFRSLVLAPGQAGRQATDDVRTSKQTWLSATYGPAAPIVDRILKLTGFPRGSEEQLQILRYDIGQKYDAHNDYFDPAMYGKQQTNRALTAYLYLSDVEEGGETWFPRASGKGPTYEYQKCDRGLRVHPLKRALVLFYGMYPDGTYDARSLHGSCPVKKGVKWGGTLWMRIPTRDG